MTIDEQPTPPPEPSPSSDEKHLAHDRMMRVGANRPPDRRISLAVLVLLVAWLGWVGGWSMLVVVAAIVVMIFLHELGHFITAKLSGMKVTEFFFGFGPKLWSFRRGETEYGVKAIPAGAYVRIIGMNNLEEIAPEDEPRTYRAQSYPKRLLVGVAGSGMHFLQTLVCLFAMLAITGAPGGHVFIQNQNDWRIVEVMDGTAASAAGLLPGDRVVSIDGQAVKDFGELHDLVIVRPGKTVAMVIDRHGDRLTLNTTLGTEDGHGKLGVKSGYPPSEKVGLVTATGRTFTEFGVGVRESFSAIGSFFSPSGLTNFASDVFHGGSSPTVSGNPSSPSNGQTTTQDTNRPVSIVGAALIGSDLTREGLYAFLGFFATINLFIGIVNLVPLLPLDGGHVVIATYERIRSRRGRRYQVDVVKLLPLTYAVVMVLGLIFVSTLFLDLADPIRIN